MNWYSCASVVIFSNSVVINSLSSFSVPFSVISLLRSARCMSLLSVGVVEYRLIIMDTDALHAHSAGLES